jgi:hypothetical protein
VHFVDTAGKGLQIAANRISQAAASCIFKFRPTVLGVLTPAAAAFLVVYPQRIHGIFRVSTLVDPHRSDPTLLAEIEVPRMFV